MLVTPQLGGQFFGMPLAPEANLVGRLFGVRDLALGALLWNVSSTFSRALSKSDTTLTNQAGRELKQILQVSMVIDSVDVISGLISAWNGEIKGKAILWGPCGAAILVGLQWVALRQLSVDV